MDTFFVRINLNVFSLLLLIATYCGVLSIYLTYKPVNQFEVHNEGKIINDPSYYSKSKNYEGWHEIDLGVFKIDFPKDYRYVSYRGIDSYVGEFTNGTSTFMFDYGWYSADMKYYSFKNSKYFTSIDTIGGETAWIVYPKKNNGLYGLYFENIKGDNDLFIGSRDIKDLDTFLKICASLKFRWSIENVTPINIGRNFISQNKELKESYHNRNLFDAY